MDKNHKSHVFAERRQAGTVREAWRGQTSKNNFVSGGLSTVRAVNPGAQTSKIIKGFPAFLILAAKPPKPLLRFGYLHVFHSFLNLGLSSLAGKRLMGCKSLRA
jgi:hypothetical protein